jgi:uncharacterized protein YndB with AHSA1/START domain
VEVMREIVMPAPLTEVWEALTVPERLEEWFANDVELEAEPGGEGTFTWDNGEVRRAHVEEVEPGRRFVFRWTDEESSPESETRVAFTLEEVPEGTRLTVTESAPTLEACAGNWRAALELQAVVRGATVLA